MKEKYSGVFKKKSVYCREKLEKICSMLEDTACDGCFSMFGHAFYIFKSGKMRWAVDPCVRTPEMKQECKDVISRLFSQLDFVVITHSHEDHYDLPLLNLLSEYDIKWYIPSFFRKSDIEKSGLCESRIHYVSDGDTFAEGENTFTAFTSAHFGVDNGKIKGVDELGFFVQTFGKTILLPGDIRDYKAKLPEFSGVDHMFSHVWLGYGKALGECDETQVRAFCDFVCRFSPKNVYLTHLYDKRPPDSLWTYSHAGMIADELSLLIPRTDVYVPIPGQKFEI